MKPSVMMPHIVKFMQRFSSNDYIDIKNFSLENKIPAVEKCAAEFIRFLVNMRKPDNILEIGCGVGFSTAYLADSGKRVVAVDYNKERIEKAKDFLKDFDNIEFIFKDVRQYLNETDEVFDFVFVDAVKRDYHEIFYLLKPKLKDGSIVVFDDVLIYGMVADELCEIPERYRKTVEIMKEFLDDMFEKYKKNIFLLPVGNGMLVLNYEC